MLDRQWLFQGIKPQASVIVTWVPLGSTLTAVPLSLFSWAAVGSVWIVGTELATPTFTLTFPPSIRTYKVFGSIVGGSHSWVAELSPADLDWYFILPEGAELAYIELGNIGATLANNAFTAELLLGRLKMFGITIGADHEFYWYLVVRNLVNFLSVEIWRGYDVVWANRYVLDSQGHKTSLYYTPLRITCIMSRRITGPLYGSVRDGTAIRVSGENALLLFGVSENPVFLSITEPLRFVNIGTFWLTHDPYFSALGIRGEGDCWLRLWLHRLTGTSIYFVPPDPNFSWIHHDCRVFGAILSKANGTLFVNWTPDQQPIFGRLVCGTVIAYPQAAVSYEAPITHVSYTAELSDNAISASGRIELAPFRLTDWETYSWVGIPFMQYQVQLRHGHIDLGRLFVGARVGINTETERVALRVSIETADNQALLKRPTIDMPFSYEYWSSDDAVRNLLARFGLAFWRHPQAANMPLLPEWYQEKSLYATWTPRLGETALDFIYRIAQLNGWRLDFTQFGTIKAYPKWLPVGSVWHAYWPTPDQAIVLADLLVGRLNVSLSDYERRNILLIYGIDAWTQFDVVKIFADLEAFLDPSSDRFMPFAVPAFIKLDKPVPEEWIDYLGQQITPRLFVSPFELEFVMPLSLKIKPNDIIVFQNANPMNFHRYEFVVTRVRHEIGREYSTVVSAMAFKQR